MFVKRQTVRRILIVVLALAALYAGVSSAATAWKAATQPILLCGNVRCDFLGYPILATVYGIACLICVAGAACLLLRGKRK